MSRRSTSPTIIAAAERRRMVLELRKTGANYRAIADQLLRQLGPDALPKGWNERYAHQDVVAELKRVRTEIGESAVEIKMMEAQRLDYALTKVMARLRLGDVTAVMPMIRIMERRAKLLGLDAPMKGSFEVTGDPERPIFLEHDYDISPEFAQSVFDILATAGAFGANVGDAEAESLDSPHADSATSGIPPAAST